MAKMHPKLGDREWLKSRIDAGLSQKEIAAEAGLTSSTMSLVAYYVRKHGLQKNLGKPEQARQAIARKYPNGRSGSLAGNWKGGRRSSTGKKPGGYIRIYMPEHPHATKGYVYEHRYVMEQKLGRLLKPEEIVDHIDRNRSNNAIENLRLHASRAQHVKDHFNARNHMMALVEKLRAIPRYGPNGFDSSFPVNVVLARDLDLVIYEALRDYTA